VQGDYYISSEPSQAAVGSATDNNIGAKEADAYQTFCNSSIKRKATTISAVSHYWLLWDRQPTTISVLTHYQNKISLDQHYGFQRQGCQNGLGRPFAASA
jgi:hypothetical protein